MTTSQRPQLAPFVPASEQVLRHAMQEALAEASAAASQGEVPVGAVLLDGDRIIARAGNARERSGNPLGHAELLVIAAGARALGRWRLCGTTLVVTLEPCAMCAGAIVNARIDHVVYGARDAKAGAAGSVVDLLAHAKLNHRPQVSEGLLAEEGAALLRAFFRARRRRGA